MRIYDQQLPGSREAYLNDPATHYARSMMRHVLAIAEIAMRTEQIPPDVRFRILMTIAVGQPSTPVDAEMRMEMTKRQLAAHGGDTRLGLPDFAADAGHEAAARTHANGDTWTCACRYTNTGEICTHCGALRPESDRG